MTDYYSVISRAVSGLRGSTYEARCALYERARAALQETLRKHNPPLSEIALANEQSAFEAAIRKVETEWLFNDMRRESEEYAALSTQRRFILTVEEFARFVRARLNDAISIIRDRGISRKERANTAGRMLLAKVIPTKGNIAASPAQGPVFVQRIQLTAKNIGRSIWQNTFGRRFQSE
jgi:hypothetical protein